LEAPAAELGRGAGSRSWKGRRPQGVEGAPAATRALSPYLRWRREGVEWRGPLHVRVPESGVGGAGGRTGRRREGVKGPAAPTLATHGGEPDTRTLALRRRREGAPCVRASDAEVGGAGSRSSRGRRQQP
jgi:hypothetical protein